MLAPGEMMMMMMIIFLVVEKLLGSVFASWLTPACLAPATVPLLLPVLLGAGTRASAISLL